ncbi:MAG: protein kinase family protein, partial [Okeania sp. SIO1H6]|nr:protein kinase family protein [Okeania sp. SIO1H6]
MSRMGAIAMRLSDLVNTVKLRGREIFTFINYPVDTIRRIFVRRAQQMYERAEFGESERKNSQKQDRQIFPPLPNFSQDKSQVESPSQARPKPIIPAETGGVQTSIQPTSLDQPIFRERSRRRRKDHKTQKVLLRDYEIRDNFGRRYKIGQCLSHSAQVRQYEATPTAQQKQQVLIQEFLTRSSYDRLPVVTYQNVKVKEFRLLLPIDVIKDYYEDNQQDIRWYLILEKIPNSLTLREYINQRYQPLTPIQFSKILQQILQTLEFLHNCYEIHFLGKIRKGIGHGNLNLDSLLVVIYASQFASNEEDEELRIYVSRLALWEQLIDNLDSKLEDRYLSKKVFEKDLKDLGKVSYFLSGGTQEDPAQDLEWHQYCHPEIKNFTVQLYSGSFQSAAQAHRELLKLPLDSKVDSPQSVLDENENFVETSQRSWIIPIILILMALLAFGSFFGGLLDSLPSSKTSKTEPNVTQKTRTLKSLEEVNIPSFLIGKRISYGADERWNIALKTPIAYGRNQQFSKHLNLLSQILFNSHSPDSFDFSHTESKEGTKEEKKERLENTIISNLEKYKFIVTSLFDDELQLLKNSKQLEIEIIAYDGLFAYVAFSDVQRKGNLPKLLSGKISLKSLKKLYSNQSLTLKELGISDSANNQETDSVNNQKNVKRSPICYKTTEEVFLVTSLFENLVLKNAQERNNFVNLINEDKNTCIKTGYSKGTARALAEFEQGGQAVIGIDLFSKVFNQCSVYPLAIVGEGKLTAVQPIIQNNGKP